MKVGIYGGSFNPIHKEHENIIIASYRELDLDKVIIVPTNNPPHKILEDVSFEERFEMLKHLYEDVPFIEISDIEKQNDGINYAYNTLKSFQNAYDEIVYIIGEDSFRDIKSWYKWQSLLKTYPICVVKRDGVKLNTELNISNYKELYNSDISILNYVGKEVSSSKIRAMINLNMDTGKYLSEKVENFIRKNNLYQNYQEIIYSVEKFVSPKTYQHMCNTVIMGLEINRECALGLNKSKVFKACLFHDIAKEKKNLEYGIPLQSLGTPVSHQFYGERIAKKVFNIQDEEILDAIKYHTSGKPNMSKLGKLVYVADMICDGRNYEGLEELRKAVFENFENGFVKCLNTTYKHVLNKNKGIYPLTIHAVKYYNKENL